MTTFRPSLERAPLSQCLDGALYSDSLNKGYTLEWSSLDPSKTALVILYKHGWEVHRWLYIPSMTEVWEKVDELENLE